MKRVLGLLVVAIAIAAIPASHALWGKAHVPIGKVQVCHKGATITVGQSALGGHVGHGDCQLPACDFANVFHTGDPCSTSGATGGKCALPNPRNDAGGVTPACAAGTF